MRRGLIFSSLRGALAILLVACIAGCGPKPPAAPAAKAVPLKEQMRTLWRPAERDFQRDFLVCGPFEQTAERPAESVDYLAGAGGEAHARPEPNQVLTAPDGASLTWQPYSSGGNMIDLRKPFPAAKDKPFVAYAYVSIHRDSPCEALMALFSKATLTVYLNGKVVVDPNNLQDAVDGAHFPVSLEAGDNSIMVRVAGATDRWPFSLRVVDAVAQPTDDTSLLRAKIVPVEEDPSALAVNVANDNRQAPAAVSVDVLGPAGKVVAHEDVPLRQTYRFDTAAWPDGPYDVRAMASSPDGKVMTRYRVWYKGDWRQEAGRVMDETDALPPDSADPVVLKKQLVRELLLARLGGDIRKAPATQPVAETSVNKVIAALLECREADMQRQSPEAFGGFYRLAWRDEVDGSPQYARVFLPLNYDPKRKYPLVVWLHGYDARNREYAAAESGTRHDNLAEQYDIIYMQPYGRGNTGYRGIGEADVMRAVALARRTFSVDDDRIYLYGGSMGGGGAWHVGTRHTDVFAAVAPIYGGWDYHAETKDEDFATWPPQRVRLEGSYSSFAQAECLLNTPIFVNHGDSDMLVDVENSRYAVRMLQRWGYDVRYWEHPGKGHGGLNIEDEMIQWFLAHRLNRNPRHVLLRSCDLDGANAHWVHVEQREDPFEPMLVDVVVNGGDVITVNSENALQIRLNPPKELLDTAKAFHVVWNGQVVDKPQVTPAGEIILLANGYAPGRLFKKPMGPTPFAIVVGTTATDERMKRFCRLHAEAERDNWKTWQHVEPRYFVDTEMTDEQIRNYSLVLYGGPEENAVTAKLIKDTPLTIEPGRITIDGKAFDTAHSAVRMVYPHPLNSDRLVVIVAANSPDAMFWANRLSDDVDFAIDDGRMGEDRDYFRSIVAWGKFDCHWRLNDKYLTVGNPSFRASALVRKVPSHLTTAVGDGRLALTDVLEAASCGSFSRMVRDRNWQGGPMKLAGRTYPSGIGVDCWHEPCKASYDLTGGSWKRLKATIGIEIEAKPEDIKPQNRSGTKVVFVVRGDGKELYKSAAFGIDSQPADIDVDITGVKELELEVYNESRWYNIASSVDWADVRLEK